MVEGTDASLINGHSVRFNSDVEATLIFNLVVVAIGISPAK